jgi:hypothetical protein
MNHTQILKRAWKILWSYRVLWIFGILLALTSSSGGGGNGVGSNSGYKFNNNNDGKGFNFTLPTDLQPTIEKLTEFFNHTFVETTQWIGYMIVFSVLILLLMVFFSFIRYVSETALFRMVERYENSEEKMNFKQGWRAGWSRSAWKLFLIDLVIVAPIILAIIVLLGCAFLPLGLSMIGNGKPALMGVVATIGLFFLFLFMSIIVSVVLGVLLEVIRRVCVLENQGVRASVRLGWMMFILNLKDIGLMWLILLGVKIGFAIVLIPLVLLFVGISLVTGALVAGAVFFALKAATTTVVGIIAAVVVGLFILFLILSLPMLFLQGLLSTYLSTSWTLAYRDLKRLELPRVETVSEILPTDDALPHPV